MKLVLGLFGLLLLIVIVGTYSKNLILPGVNFLNNGASTTIDSQKFDVDVAKNEKDREIGLSGRSSLDQNKGMLFVFDTAGQPHFWMKNMQFPIDIIFINNNKIVTEFSNIKPSPKGTQDAQIPLYTPTQNADHVLEINAGLITKYNFKNGDNVDISGI